MDIDHTWDILSFFNWTQNSNNMAPVTLSTCVLILLTFTVHGVSAESGPDPVVGLVVAAVLAFFILIGAIVVCMIGIVWNDWYPRRQWLRGKQKVERVKFEHQPLENDAVSVVSKAGSSLRNHQPKILSESIHLTELNDVRPMMNGMVVNDSPRYEEKGQMLNFGDEDGDTKYQVTSPSEIEYNERQIVPIMSQQPPTPRQMQLVQQPQQQIIQRELIPVVQHIQHDEPIITQVEKQPVIVKVVHRYPTATQVIEEPVIAEVTHTEKVITKRVDVPLVKEIEHDQPIVTEYQERPYVAKELHKYPTSMKVIEKPMVKTIEHDEPVVTKVQEKEVVTRELHQYPTATRIVEKPVVKRIEHSEPLITDVKERPLVTKEIHQYPTATRVVEKPVVKTIEHAEKVVTDVREQPVVTKELHKYPTSTKVIQKPLIRNVEHGKPLVTNVIEKPYVATERHSYPTVTRVVERPISNEVVHGRSVATGSKIVRGSVSDGQNIVERVIQMPSHGPPSYEYSKQVLDTKKGKRRSSKKKTKEESQKDPQYETVTGVMNFGTERQSDTSSYTTDSDSDSDSDSGSLSSGSGYIQPTLEDPGREQEIQSDVNQQWTMY